jgi:hypothetical protein
MQKSRTRAALCLSQEGEQDQEFLELAEIYCEEHGYRLWSGDLLKEQGAYISLEWIEEVMSALAIDTLLIPSLTHIHPTDMGHLLHFLMKAQERLMEIVCLNPIPTPLCHFTLAVVPLTDEQQISGVLSLPEIIRCLRFG